MKSGVLQLTVNNCMVSACLMGRSNVLSVNITSGPVTALITVRKTGIFCRGYLKTNEPFRRYDRRVHGSKVVPVNSIYLLSSKKC